MDFFEMKNKRLIPLILAAAVLAAFAAVYTVQERQRCAMRTAPEPAEAAGDVVAGPTIVSLVPSVTETLFMLGLGRNVIARSDYCNFPDSVTNLPSVGSLANINIEAIARMKPDWVILSDAQSQTRIHSALAELRINHLGVPANSLDDVIQSVWDLAGKFGAEANAAEWMKQLDATIAEARLGAPPRKPRILICAGRDPNDMQRIYIAGKGNFYSDVVGIAGGENAYDGNLPFPMVSLEGIAKMNPDIIVDVLVGPGVDSDLVADALFNWSRLPTVKAVASADVHVLTEEWAVRPGPRIGLLIDAVSEFAKEWHDGDDD